MLVYNIINETIRNYLQDFLLENKQEKTIRNKIVNGIAAITKMDVASTKVQTMANEVWDTYVEHPMHDNIHKRQNNEIWAINYVIDRLMPYIIRKRDDGSFFVNKSSRLKNAWENLIQAQSAEHISKMPVWNSDDNLHYWNANKRYNDALEAAKKQAINNIEGQGNYSVYHIDDYDAPIEGLGITLTQLGTYTGGKGAIPLCYTQSKGTYDGFTKDNKYDMYALLRDGWQKEKCVVDKSTFPFDSYGLSMIFVVIDNNGGLFHSNVRWNHGPKGNDVGNKVDNIFSYSKLVEVVGSNVMKQIGANAAIDNDFTLTYEVEQKLQQGIPIDKIFDYIFSAQKGYCMVEFNEKINYIDEHTNELISDIWFDAGLPFCKSGFAKVKKDNKYNYLREDGTFALDTLDTNEWFDSFEFFRHGFAKVTKNGKENFIRENGTLVWNTLDTNKWFDDFSDIVNGFAIVIKDNKWNFIRENGTLVWDTLDTNEWFDFCYYFVNGFAKVSKGGKFQSLSVDGKLYDEPPTTDNIIQECINRYLKNNLLIC